jgi:hypothetical protein
MPPLFGLELLGTAVTRAAFDLPAQVGDQPAARCPRAQSRILTIC